MQSQHSAVETGQRHENVSWQLVSGPIIDSEYKKERNFISDSLTLKMGATRSSETFVDFQRTT
jgi:hypothetical protein